MAPVAPQRGAGLVSCLSAVNMAVDVLTMLMRLLVYLVGHS